MRVAAPRPSLIPAVAVGAALLGAALLGFAATTGSMMIVLGVIAIAAAIAVVWDWTVGVPLLLIVSVTDGFIKHVAANTAAFILKDIILALLLLGLALRLGLRSEDRPNGVRWRGVVAWAAYIGFLASQLIHPASTIGEAITAFRTHAAFSMLFVVGAIYFQHRERLPRMANLAIVLCSWCAISALIQHQLGLRWLHISPGLTKASLHYMAWPSEAARASGLTAGTFRMYGTLVDPASLGLACTYGVIIAVAALARLHGIWRLLAIASIPLMATGLMLSQARADMAALGAGLILLTALAMQSKATRGFAIGGLLMIVLAIPLGIVATHGTVLDRLLAKDEVAYAQATRDHSRDQVLNNLGRYPFGHGMGATTEAGVIAHDHNSNVLSVDNVFYANLYETGFIGLGLFLTVQVTLLVLGVRAALRTQEIGAKTVFIGVVSAQFGMLVSCWFSQGSFDYAPLAEFFWLFSGAVARSDAWA